MRLASAYGVHPNQATQWKKQALKELPELFSDRRVKSQLAEEELKVRLYQEIGPLKVALDWIKKKSGIANLDKAELDSSNR
jgi:transposase-like protein